MDLILELLEDPAYRHILMNHLPITGLGMAWLVLGWAVYDRRWPTLVFALSLVLVTSAAVWPVMATGEDAYPFVFDNLNGVGRDWLDHHVVMADRWSKLLMANSVLAALAIVAGFYREKMRRIAGIVVLVSTVVALSAAAVIAEAGGNVSHPEFRLVDPPIHDIPGRIR